MNADITFREEGDPVDFGRNFVGSEAFRALFSEGMNLVEETGGVSRRRRTRGIEIVVAAGFR